MIEDIKTIVQACDIDDAVPARDRKLEKIHLIFKTHLDVGFTDYARNVREKYFKIFFPQAIEIGERLRQSGGPERFVWTTGSWILYEYLEAATPGERRCMEQAIEAGDIAWHGLPFTTHSELMDASLFQFGLGLARKLDRRFGRETIAAKMSDVPGHTRAIVPLLASEGIRFLHIGVNAASTPPDVPPLFVWRHSDGSEVIVMYHKSSYGDAMIPSGLDSGIVFAHTNDNLGPQTLERVIEEFALTRTEFPGAIVEASTMDAYARQLQSIKDSLPVLTGEIGDTWIHGVGSDPRKVAHFRALSRLRTRWMQDGEGPQDATALDRFSRHLLCVPEHTWGMDEKTHLKDLTHYRPGELAQARQRPEFQAFEASWAEQRGYLEQAMAALGDTPQARQAEAAVGACMPVRPSMDGLKPVGVIDQVFETTHFQIGFDPRQGCIGHLLDKASGRVWATAGHPLALFGYQTFSGADYTRFLDQYVTDKTHVLDGHSVWSWAYYDFSKPGIEQAGAVARTWSPWPAGLWHGEDEQGHTFLMLLEGPLDAADDFGCPRQMALRVSLPHDEPVLQLDFQWFDKQANRLPEALWLSFQPPLPKAARLTLNKMGEPIAADEVIGKGNRRLHAVQDGAWLHDEEGGMWLETLDAPLLAMGDKNLLDFNDLLPDLSGGVHVNLYNNLWGTNFPMWYEEDALFRFKVDFRA